MGDITYIPTDEGYCFMASVLDVSSRLLAGWSLQAHMRTSLCTDALLSALGRRGSLAGATFHTDYAEVFVKPRDRGLACAGAVC